MLTNIEVEEFKRVVNKYAGKVTEIGRHLFTLQDMLNRLMSENNELRELLAQQATHKIQGGDPTPVPMNETAETQPSVSRGKKKVVA